MASKIPEYDNPVGGLRTDERGTDALLQVARRGGAFFNQAADAVRTVGDQFGRNLDTSIRDAGGVLVDYLKHQDTSQYNTAASAVAAKAATDWNQSVSGVKNPQWDGKDPNTKWLQKPLDPDDPNAVKGFKEKLDASLEELKGSMRTVAGEEHAESHNTALREHFATVTAASISNLAGEAARVKTVTTINNYSNAAVADPAGVQGYAKLAQQAIEAEYDNHPGLKGDAGVKAKTEYTMQAMKKIYHAAALSAIEKAGNPEAVAKMFAAKYPDYIDGAEALTLAKAARASIRLQNAETRAAEAQERRADTDAFHRAANDFEVSTTKVNKDTGAVEPFSPQGARQTLLDLAKMPNADPGRIAALTHRLEQVGTAVDDTTQKNIAKTSRATQAEFVSRTLEGNPVTPKELDTAYVNKKLTWEAKEALKRDYYADTSATGEKIFQRRTEYLKSHEGELDPARMIAGLKSPNGSVAIDKAGQALRKAEADLRTANKDPQSLYEYDDNGVSPADKIIKGFNVPLSDLAENLQKAMGITGGGAPKPIPDVPPGTSIPDAIKKYGKGAPVRVNGKIVTLPNE